MTAAGGPEVLQEQQLSKPEITDPTHMLVRLKAAGINPVDTKLRKGGLLMPGTLPAILGCDGAGVVEAVGSSVSGFSPGDEVFFCYGGLGQPSGNYAEYNVIPSFAAAKKPAAIDFPEAAAAPLVLITAWEALFDNMQVEQGVKGGARAIVIIGGAGGVGSIAIQLARQLTDLIVIASASRAETQAWVKKMGAHHVIDHRQNMAAQIAALDIGEPAFVLVTTHSNQHAEDVASFIAPQGKLSIIEDLDNISHFKAKSVSIHWEFMFTRSMFATADMAMQGEILTNVAKLLDEGKLVTTLHTRLSPINAATLIQAHRQIESATTIGKVVIEDFS